MKLYFAPMEGITDAVYRRLHYETFGGVEKYFIPFISPTVHVGLTSREKRCVSREANEGIPVVPQLLSRDADATVQMLQLLADEGYEEVNLNFGCPSGTVTAKGKGSGMLRDLNGLKAYLDAVFARTPVKVSVKTRIGWEDPAEWESLSALYRQYPIAELTVHLRTRSQFYRGQVHRELAASMEGLPFICNGDLFSPTDCLRFLNDFPFTTGLMIGRGLVANPGLARELNGGPRVTAAELRAFHDRLYAAYKANWPANALLGHMNEITHYMGTCFEDAAKPRKALRKARTEADYLAGADRLFACALKDPPAFDIWEK